MKTCSKCNRELSIDMFGKQKAGKDGIRSTCKECRKIEDKLYRLNNPEKRKEIQKRHYETHKEENKKYREEHRESAKKYYEEHKEERKEEKRLKAKEYYQKNREQILEQNKQNVDARRIYKRAHYKIAKENTTDFYLNVLEHRKQYYKNNKKQILVQMKEYQEKNPEIHKKANKTYSITHAEKIKEYKAKRFQNNREYFKQMKARRKALELNNTVGKVSYKEILERDGLHCHICGKDITDGNYHFDHVIPLSRGGAHSMDNIKVAHAFCNLSKNNKLPEEM